VTSTEGDDRPEFASDLDCSDCDSEEYSDDGVDGDDGYSAANGPAGVKKDVEFFKRRLHEPYCPGELPCMCKCKFLLCHLISPTKSKCKFLLCHSYHSQRVQSYSS
jgi:hypothetical protein